MLTVHPTLLIGPSDWQPERMPSEEFARRIDALWRTLPGASRAIVYGNSRHHAELAYLTNFVPKLEPAVALLSPTGEHRAVCRRRRQHAGRRAAADLDQDLAPLGDGERDRPVGWRASKANGRPCRS